MKKLFVCTLALIFSHQLLASESMIFRAMQDELDRSMKTLEFESFDKPYYLSYRLVDSQRYSISSTLGATLEKRSDTMRELVVDLRVGDYELDSSNLFELSFRRVPMLIEFDHRIAVPIDADYTEIRRVLWLATDNAYKKAVQRFAKKQAILANLQEKTREDDFLKVEKIEHVEFPKSAEVDLESMEQLLNILSGSAKKYEGIDTSEVDWKYSASYTRIVDSEGRKIGRNDHSNRIVVRAETQAQDGELLFDESSYFAITPDTLRKQADLKENVEQQFKLISERRIQPKFETYVGPVMLKPKAAAELFRQTFARQAVAYRQPEKDPSMGFLGIQNNTLQGRLGQRILPRDLTITDNPLLRKFKSEKLLGSYAADDQGVKASSQVLVKNGRLEQLVSERTSIKETKVNGGNYLNGSLAMSNLIVESKSPLTKDELAQEFISLIEESGQDFGIVIEKLDGEFQRLDKRRRVYLFGDEAQIALDGLVAYKLFKNGKRELVRQVRLPNFDMRVLKDIVAVGDDYQVYHAPAAEVKKNMFVFNTITRKSNVSSFIVPTVLFEELSVFPQEDAIISLPVRKHSK
ncbi:MAG: metallopeptidase TldD-related protein [Kangiellaceae bacterium]|nr:metallopeptidase TldD-related protein [Kangiellaceae bacterium]